MSAILPRPLCCNLWFYFCVKKLSIKLLFIILWSLSGVLMYTCVMYFHCVELLPSGYTEYTLNQTYCKPISVYILRCSGVNWLWMGISVWVHNDVEVVKPNQWVSEWVSEWVGGWVRVGGWVSECECVSECEWVSASTCECECKWVSVSASEWVQVSDCIWVSASDECKWWVSEWYVRDRREGCVIFVDFFLPCPFFGTSSVQTCSPKLMIKILVICIWEASYSSCLP